ncbi:MAG: hypothetical protein AAFP90_01735 [Planctomycetota bacterium]
MTGVSMNESEATPRCIARQFERLSAETTERWNQPANADNEKR